LHQQFRLTKDVIFCNKIHILKIINQILLFFSIFQAMKTFKEWGYKSPEASSLLKRVQDKVHSLLPGAEIILYGSRARLEADLESDWDFLILLDEMPDQKTVAVLRDRLYELELESDTVLSTIVRCWDEWNSELYAILPFKEIVERDGVIL
jgi:predicted nucleotidyltransferase